MRGHLELERGDDRGKVRVAGALAVAVHRALHVHAAGLDGDERIGYRAARVVVRVDAERHVEYERHLAHDLQHLVRHRSAVRVAEHDRRGACVGGRSADLERVARIGLVAVEEVLGVEEDRAIAGGQEGHRVAHHLDVALERGLQGLGHVDRPGLAKDAQRRAPGIEQRIEPGVVFSREVLVARRAEGRDDGVLELQVARALEELDVFGVGAGKTAST